MNCWFMIKIIYEQYLNQIRILLCMIGYLCKSLRIISLVCVEDITLRVTRQEGPGYSKWSSREAQYQA